MKRNAVVLLLVAIIGAVFILNPKETRFFRQENQLLGTSVSVTFYGKDKNLEVVSNAVFKMLYDIENTINIFDPNSEISRLNRSASEQPFVCSDELWSFILAGRQSYEVSDGLFDVSVAPLMTLWGIHRKQNHWPNEDKVNATVKLVGLNKITFDDQTQSVFFQKKGMKLDFGGLVKGIALDRSRKIMEQFGLKIGLVNLGGNVYCSKEVPEGRAFFNIGIKNPDHGLSDVISVKDCFVATSGDYERFTYLDGRKVSHIINPLTGYPVEQVASVSVITKSGIHSDLFSTALFINRKKLEKKLLALEPTLEYMVITHNESDGFSYETHGKNWNKESN